MSKETVIANLEDKSNRYLEEAKRKALEALTGHEDDRAEGEASALESYIKHKVMLEAIGAVDYHLKK